MSIVLAGGITLNSNNRGSFLILIAVILWSFSGFIIKTVEASALWIILIRSLAGGIFLSPFIFRRKIYPLKIVFLAGVFMALFLLSITVTTKISSAAMAISMQYAAPMYVIGYGFIKNKRIDYKKLLVLILIFIGVSINVLNSLKEANTVAMFSGLAIGITFILYSLSLQKINEGSPLGIIALINLICAFFYMLALPFNYENPPATLREILLLLLAGVFISGLSYALYGAGLRKVNIERAMIIGLAEPILNPIWVYLGNREIPEPMIMVGIAFILLGAVADIVLRKKGTEESVVK